MSDRKNSGNDDSTARGVPSKRFVFLDKRTGRRQFELRANPQGGIPLDRAVNSLAMRCLLGKKSPGDFCVAVGVNVALSGVLAQRVRKLMQECEDVPLAVQIGSRQKEVLELVLLKLSNKEIAMQVHISQTTVKYHISALLRKFKLKNRLSLIQRSDDLTPAAGWLAEVAPPSLIFASGDLVERLIVADTHPSIFRSGPGGKRAGTR